MKKILIVILLLSNFWAIGQHDYTGKVVIAEVPAWGLEKILVFTPSEEKLYLPSPNLANTGRLIAIQTKDLYTSFVRLNVNVNAMATVGNPAISYLPRYTTSDSLSTLYLYSTGSIYELYYDYQLPKIAPYSTLKAAISVVQTKYTDATIISSEFGKRIKIVSDGIQYSIPNPTTITPYKSFTIVNQGSQNVVLSYPFFTDKTSRYGIPPNSGANNYEIFSDGTVYRAISGN